MTTPDRERLESHLLELTDRYGPWAVLWVVVECLRFPFKELAAKEAPVRPRAKGGAGG